MSESREGSPQAGDPGPPREAHARWSVGDVIRHQRFGYRGVIVDVDPVFAGSDEWYDQVARSRPPRDAPWYHVLVDGQQHATYVAERHIGPDAEGGPVRHPAIEDFFDGFADGRHLCLRGMH